VNESDSAAIREQQFSVSRRRGFVEFRVSTEPGKLFSQTRRCTDNDDRRITIGWQPEMIVFLKLDRHGFRARIKEVGTDKLFVQPPLTWQYLVFCQRGLDKPGKQDRSRGQAPDDDCACRQIESRRQDEPR